MLFKNFHTHYRVKTMKVYQTKSSKLSGSDFHEVRKQAEAIYARIRNRTKRRPYIRSVYFKKDKIFLALFWQHLFDKENWKDRVRRLKYFPPALELIRYTKIDPTSKENPNKSGEILHRFIGQTCDKENFIVQIKEEKRNSQKYLISVYPKQ